MNEIEANVLMWVLGITCVCIGGTALYFIFDSLICDDSEKEYDEKDDLAKGERGE